jgi:nickel transport protein
MRTKPAASFATLAAAAALTGFLGATPAAAHNLIMEAYVIGNSVEGEAFFSDGTFVKNTPITITDASGKQIQTVTTDAEGGFRYTPLQAVTQKLTIDVGSGHVASVTLDGAKFAGGVPTAAAPAPAASVPAPTAATPAATPADAGVAAEIGQLVAAEVVPLETEIQRYKSHNDQMNLLAAIGLLCGFAGVLLFSAGAAKMRAVQAAQKGGMGASRTQRA